MTMIVRRLTIDDKPLVEAMDTGIENDYIINIFDKLTEGIHRIYGLFNQGQIVSIAGYSIYEGKYAMLGRLRSDRQYRGKNFATKILAYARDAAFANPDIMWVGSNTQEENLPAQRVIEKLGLTRKQKLHEARITDFSNGDTYGETWNEITDIDKKRALLKKEYTDEDRVFPYEPFYPFPASEALFTDENLHNWTFYENPEKNRFLITKIDLKYAYFLHAVYPWNDLKDQQGLWQTIQQAYEKAKAEKGDDTIAWMDLTDSQIAALGTDHHFELASPWLLYGISRQEYTDKLLRMK